MVPLLLYSRKHKAIISDTYLEVCEWWLGGLVVHVVLVAARRTGRAAAPLPK